MCVINKKSSFKLIIHKAVFLGTKFTHGFVDKH